MTSTRVPAATTPRSLRGRTGLLLPVAVAGGIGLAVGVSAVVDPHHALRQGALFVHLGCLVLGFGGVLGVDWMAAGWVLGRRPFGDVLTAARHAHLPIWVGYTGLVVSGSLLEPDLHHPATLVKLGLVLVIGWNGALAGAVQSRLGARPPRGRLLVLSTASAGLSQTCWWGATTIGFLNAGSTSA